MKNFLFFLGFFFITSSGLAQSTITGTITDSDGEPLISATVRESGVSNNATFTNIDGDYVLTMEDDSNPIIVSYTGYSAQTIPLDGRTSINVSLIEDGSLLQEVVVNALGIEERRDEQGYTNSIIQSDDVNRSGEANLINGLGAKASNVRISRSNGDPGAGSTIRIRGANSISSGNPLIIVDGVPLNNSTTYTGGNGITGGRTGGVSQQSRLNDINPADIESIQVLKGASAGALWGSRAANGVIVITTKDGKAGKAKISFKSTYSIDEVSERIPMQTVWGQGRNGSFSPTSAESWGDYIPDRSGGADDVNTGGQFWTANDGSIYYPISTKNSRETFTDRNFEDAIGTGDFFQNDLTISGGGDKATYFFNLGRLDQNGIIQNSFYDRTNLRFNSEMFLSDLVTLSTKFTYANTQSNRIQQNSNTAGLMLGLLRTPPDFDDTDYLGTYTSSTGQEFPNRQRSYRRYLGNSQNPIYNNALWTTNEQEANSDVNRYVITPQLDFNPVSWLTFILRGSADISDDKQLYFFPVGSGGSRNVGIFSEDILNRKALNLDVISKANFELTDNVSLSPTIGWSLNDRTYRRNSGRIEGFLVNARKESVSLNTAAEASEFTNFKSFQRSNRGYGVLGIDVSDQLFVNLTGAAEASSTLNGTFFYPAADVAWNFSKTAFQPDWLSFGKLRGSYGQVGVQADPHRAQTLAETGFSYSTYSDPLDVSLFSGGFRLDDDLGNPNLKPERKTEWEIGTDLRFLEDRLAFTFTHYQNEIEDILISTELSPSSGFDTQYGNFGSMENDGVEMDIAYDAIQKDDLTLNVFANWAKNNNVVTDIAGSETIDLTGLSVSSRAIVGQPLGVLYGTGAQTDASGNFILDANGFPQATTSPVVLGDPNPDWRGGFGFGFTYKKFGLNALLEHSQGGDFSPRSLWVLRRFGTTQETANRFTTTQALTNFDGDVIPAGTTVRGNVTDFGGGPVLLDETWYRHGIGGGFGDNQLYNFNIFDATYTKFRELTASYRFDGDGFKKALPIEGLTILATARNLFAWDQIDGIDPETNLVGVGNGYGIEYFTNPQTQSFLISINADF